MSRQKPYPTTPHPSSGKLIGYQCAHAYLRVSAYYGKFQNSALKLAKKMNGRRVSSHRLHNSAGNCQINVKMQNKEII